MFDAKCRGSGYTSDPTATFLDDEGNPVPLNVIVGGGQVLDVVGVGQNPPYLLSGPRDVTFTGGSPSTPAVARVYPVAQLVGAAPTSPLVSGYSQEVQVSFIGEDFSDVAGVSIPEIDFTIPPGGQITQSDVTLVSPGAGLTYNIDFEIAGGRGFDAVLLPIVAGAGTSTPGKILAVRVLRGGSNYLPEGQVFAFIDNPAHSGDAAQLEVKITNGVVTDVVVVNGGSGYTDAATIKLVSNPGPYVPPPDPVFLDNPKGVPARFTAVVDAGTGEVTSLNKFGTPPGKTDMTYIPGSEGQATVASIPAFIWWFSNAPFARTTGLAGGYLAQPAAVESEVGQVLFSSAIAQFNLFAGNDLKPFGGGFLGQSAPDGYGLGGQLGSASKFIGDLFSMQQSLGDVPPLIPSNYAVNDARVPVTSFEFPIYQEHAPFVTMSGALKSSVQGLQRTLTQLFLDPPSTNTPPSDSENTWKMDYFAIYDDGVGRLVLNPTATQPAFGGVSSVQDPGTIPSAENDPKTGLSKWQPGMIWSGFLVSDQWNDQHYFYGYFLSAAAIAGIFDRAWEPTITGKPVDLWAGPAQMGTGLEQMMLTMANNPDDAALDAVLYKNANFSYQKLAFFDQWSGHPWAAGLSPGSTTAVLNAVDNPLGFWGAYGTLNAKYNGENENSAFEGMQAWSATVLWGGATDRKKVADLGISLLSTSLAALDAYFLDKNYNQTDSANNAYSWVPVTTIDATQVPKNLGNDWPVNTSYATANPDAFYKAPEFFGDSSGSDASPGISLIKKVENSLNNFFYAYPTGSKFIQAYPPTPWTMGIARNSNFMKKWAGAMMRQEWKDARNSSLYQAADWNAMALSSALSGVPYNPGDTPYPLTGTSPNLPLLPTYTQRLWSSWVTPNSRPGSEASLQPPFTATSVLGFLLSLERYGTPDWTYIGRVTNAGGQDDNDSILYMATFSKQVSPTTVETTFVAFNPGWTTRYAVFQRLNVDGTINPQRMSGANPVPVAPKRMVTVKQTFTVQ